MSATIAISLRGLAQKVVSDVTVTVVYGPNLCCMLSSFNDAMIHVTEASAGLQLILLTHAYGQSAYLKQAEVEKVGGTAEGH